MGERAEQAGECGHGSTYTVEFDTLEFCLECGELARYFADDAQEWVEVR